MARSKSIILSKEEKKALVADLKTKIAAVKQQVKEVSGTLKAEIKDHAAFVKLTEKTIAGLNKELAGYQAQLGNLATKPPSA